MKKILMIFSLLPWAALAPVCAQDSTGVQLDSLVAEAIRQNPQLSALRNGTEGIRTRADQATAWEAPQAGVEFFQTPIKSFPNPVKNGMETDYFLQQMIPFPGKLSAMGRAAEFGTKEAEEGYATAERKIVADLKSAYYQLYLVQRKIEVNAETQEVMRKFEDITRHQYEVGMGGQDDILRAQTELSTLVNMGVSLRKEKQVAEAMINTLLSRPADSALGTVPGILRDIRPLDFDRVVALAYDNRPELLGMGYSVEMNRAETSASRRDYYPDIMVRFMYKDMAMTPNDFWSAMVGITLPFAPWSIGGHSAKVEEGEYNTRKAEAGFTAMKNMVSYEVRQALAGVDTDRDLVLLYRTTVIPQAEQTLQSTTAAYRTGKSGFLSLIDAYRMLLSSRLEYYTSVASYMTSQARLEQAVGLNISEIEAYLR